MKIKSLHIKNFKSIVDLTINEPNPFTVFVGPNGSGKSNIFEALEFIIMSHSFNNDAFDLLNKIFGTRKNANQIKRVTEIEIKFERFNSKIFDSEPNLSNFFRSLSSNKNILINYFKQEQDYQQFLANFTKLFVRIGLNQIIYASDYKLNSDSNNLEKVLKRLLENKEKREEISEWLELFLPEFDRIEVQKAQYSSNEDLLIYQKHYKEPFNKELISDGTYNIIALLTAVYQSDEPQFLCIEEPENGLHPFVQKELVNFFRWACEEYGHYIWLNTHSQSIVSQLTKDEIITVNKEKGETIIKQHKDTELYGLPIDEAWLNKVLGGNTKWL